MKAVPPRVHIKSPLIVRSVENRLTILPLPVPYKYFLTLVLYRHTPHNRQIGYYFIGARLYICMYSTCTLCMYEFNINNRGRNLPLPHPSACEIIPLNRQVLGLVKYPRSFVLSSENLDPESLTNVAHRAETSDSGPGHHPISSHPLPYLPPSASYSVGIPSHPGGHT